jgi:glycosyltransferase involved in cell wall biosynthesis
MERQARREMRANPRYIWLGELPRWRTRALIARSRLLALPSRAEGGAHVVGEAATSGVPLLVTAIPGTLGLLGADYPGTFPVGDAPALAALLRRAETEPPFLTALEAAVQRVAPRFDPRREREAWAALLAELGVGREQ